MMKAKRLAFLAFLLSVTVFVWAVLNFGMNLVSTFDLFGRSSGGQVVSQPTSSPDGRSADLRWSIYTNNVLGYSMKYPNGMEISTYPLGGIPDAGVSFAMFGSTQMPQAGFTDGMMGDIVLNSTTKLRSVDQYFSEPSKDFPFPGPRRKPAVVGSANAIWTEGEEQEDGATVNFVTIYVPHPEGILIISAIFTGPETRRHRDTFDQMISSFSFLPQRKP
jgi:hypothetical protein